MAGRIVLFGATGYTGTLTAEELAAQGVTAVLAGRDRPRLDVLASRLGGDSKGSGCPPDHLSDTRRAGAGEPDPDRRRRRGNRADAQL